MWPALQRCHRPSGTPAGRILRPVVSSASMLDLLKNHFGFDEFLPLQEEIISSVMGGNDTFALMPTGGGKSLCYQLPALAMGGLTLVVSPLIALMKDQVDALKANGIPAGFINSSLTQGQILRAEQMVREGRIKILYVAPERAILPEFREFLESLDVRLLAIDEAHCVSHWGHDFRPAYRDLKTLREVTHGAPAIALTATATKPVRDDILTELGLRQPQVFISSFNRPNLTYAVEPKEKSLEPLLDLLGKHQGESAIIYCTARKSTEEMAQALSRHGFKAEAYHAGLEPEARRAVQDRFIRDETPIVAATIAFGMGIDKPDIRLVVHYDMPKNLEGYYQETGRAGRDGMPSECVLFYSYADMAKQEYFLGRMEDVEERERSRKRLAQMVEFCNIGTCRRKYVLEYLGEDWPEQDCGGCDVCLAPQEEYDATEVAQKFLSAVVRTGETFGPAYVIRVLLGSGDKRIREYGHDQLSVFGIVRDHSREELHHLVSALTSKGLLANPGGQYPTLQVTPEGRRFLQSRDSLTLTRAVRRPETDGTRTDSRPSRSGRQDRVRTGAHDHESYDEELFRELSDLRKQIADQQGVPAFVIFGDRSLRDMAAKSPVTRDEFAQIYGVGEAKIRELSGPFIGVIRAYVDRRGTSRAGAPRERVAKADRPIGEKRSRTAGESFRETGRLISAGASVAEVAHLRGLMETTIVGHLEHLVREGEEVEFDHLLPTGQRLDAINDAFEVMGHQLLRPVFDELGGSCSYQELRLARLNKLRDRSVPTPSTSQ